MKNDKMVRLLVIQEKFVWEANAALRRSDSDIVMTKLYAINPAAAIYSNAIPLPKWTLHVQYDATPLYVWRVTNFVESASKQSPLKVTAYDAVRVLQGLYDDCDG